MDLSNLTITVGDKNFTSDAGEANFFHIFLSINIVFVALTNSLLLVVLLSSPSLRHLLRVQLIVCMALFDFLNGVIGSSFFANVASTFKWELGCALHFTLQIALVFADVFLVMWYLVLLDVTYFFQLMKIRIPKLSPLGNKLCRVVLIASPILLLCVIVLPIIFTHLEDVTPSNQLFCPLYLEDPYEVAMTFIIFFLPATSLAIFSAFFFIFRKDTVYTREMLVRNLVDHNTMIEKPLYFVLPFVVVVTLSGPEQLMNALFFSNLLPGDSPYWIYKAVSILELGRGWILSLSWLIFPDIRLAYCELFNRIKKCCHGTKNMNVTNVAYKGLQDQ